MLWALVKVKVKKTSDRSVKYFASLRPDYPLCETPALKKFRADAYITMHRKRSELADILRFTDKSLSRGIRPFELRRMKYYLDTWSIIIAQLPLLTVFPI
jgi:hypothetical protein